MSFRNSSKETTATNKSKPFAHYVDLFIRKVWYIIPVVVVTFIGWLIVMNSTGMIKPELEATSILQFDDPDDISAVDERVNLQADTRAVLVKSRTFLDQIAYKLSLQLRTKRHARTDIFDSVKVGIDAAQGEYVLKIQDSIYTFYYRAPMSKHSAEIIRSGSVTTLDNVVIDGISLFWNRTYLENPYTFTFTITSMRVAVDFILDNVSVEISGTDGNILSITMRGKDARLMTEIVNAIADGFVYSHSRTKQERRDTILSILEKQLATAKNDMLSAESALRRFREKHPTLGLQDAFSPPTEIITLKENEAELKSTLLQAQSLQNRFASVNDSQRVGLLTEMVSFLNRYQTATAQGLQNELTTLMTEAENLKQTYSPHHPEVKKNVRNMELLGIKISSALTDLMGQINRKINENNYKIDKMNQEISNLPSRELQFFNLQRRYEVNTEIYAAVLTRYNEARIAESVKTGDVHVVDHAVPPDKGIDIKILFVFMLLGLCVSLTTGMTPVLIADFIDKTAHSSRDIHRMTNLNVLESIPIKGSWKNQPVQQPDNEKSKINDFVYETYRSLRTKIMLSLQDELPKRLLVTSLTMDEGKSFTTVHLGMAVAQLEKPTLLIDADLHKGSLNNFFGLERKAGLSDLLNSREEIKTSLIQNYIHPTRIQHLTLLCSGSIQENAAGLLNSERFKHILDVLSNNFEVIIIDTPPFAVVTDAISLQDLVSKFLLVVRASHTNIIELSRKIKEFPGLHKKILGVILNGASYKRMEYYHYTHYHHKYDK